VKFGILRLSFPHVVSRVLITTAFLIPGLASPQAPLTVDTSGTLLLHGKPFRGIGVNVADAFWRVLANPADTSYEATFATLARRHVPFARIPACPYWPSEYGLYRNDPDAYFARLDGVVRAAEKSGVGLILSLNWAHFAVPDLIGEPVNAWGKTDSATMAFMRRYTQVVVKRYLDSPAVWIWELGNEFSLAADIEPLPPVVPTLGTPDARSDADRAATSDFIVAWTEFGKAVRELDSVRPITTGNSLPRPPSEQLRRDKTWSPLDSRADLKVNLVLATPSPMNMMSVPLYPDDIKTARFAPDYHATYAELVTLCTEAAASFQKALFVGEFGAPGSDASAREAIVAMIAAFVGSKVALAAVWNFDWRLGGGSQEEWNITETNERSFILDAIERANAEIASSHPRSSQ